jgi:hypothetical protein
MNDLKDTLADLVKHPGWQWFCAVVQEDWGAGGLRFEAQLNKIADSRDDDAANFRQMQQIAVARREILRLLKRPEEELQKLTPAVVDWQARGAMAPELAGMSRRGGL